MQLLFDFFPVIAFFIAYKLADIYVATGVIIVAVLAQAAIQWVRHRKISSMMLISGGMVLVFGGLTLWLHDETFIKWKITVVNVLLAGGFLLSHYLGERPVIERMMGDNFKLARAEWLKLSWMWIAFFALLAVVNMYIVFNFSTDIWVKFKLYGTIGLTLVFLVLQVMWLSSKLPAEPADSTDAPKP